MIELTTTVLFLLGSFYGDSGKAPVTPVPVPRESFEQLANQPVTLEEYVREYFKDTPILAEIAKCESRFRHVGLDGRTIRGEITIEDLGVMQINEYFHNERADRLGFDLHTLDGNLAYAKWLHAKEGTTPWLSSGKCWQKYEKIAEAPHFQVRN